MTRPRTGRRHLLAMLTTLPAATRAGRLLAATPATASGGAPFAETPRLFVAGPSDGALNHWADALLPALEQSLPPDTSIRRVEIGSADGVTGANQFEARGAPDGQTVLLVPGQAARRLDGRRPTRAVRRRPLGAGHRRRQPRHRGRAPDGAGTGWPRAGRRRRPGQLRPRGAAGRPSARRPTWSRCSAWANRTRRSSAFAQGAVDAVLLRGDRVPERFAALAAAGAQPLFTLGVLDDDGHIGRDPAYPQVPHFGELVSDADRQPAEWRAVRCLERHRGGGKTGIRPGAAAAHPGVDGCALAARRRRCRRRHSACRRPRNWRGVRPLAGLVATVNTSALAASAPAMTALRRWLASRLNWRPA